MARFAVVGSDLPFSFTVTGFDSMTVETQVLRDRDVSVAPTLLKARKLTFRYKKRLISPGVRLVSFIIDRVSLVWGCLWFLVPPRNRYRP